MTFVYEIYLIWLRNHKIILIVILLQNLHLKSKVKEAEKEIIAIGQAQVSVYSNVMIFATKHFYLFWLIVYGLNYKLLSMSMYWNLFIVFRHSDQTKSNVELLSLILMAICKY